MMKIFALLFLLSSPAFAYNNYSNRLPGDPNVKTVLDLNAINFTPYLDAFSFTASGSGTTTTTYQIPVNIVYVGIKTEISGQNLGDYAKVELVDVDNLLGFGANYVLATPVVKQYVSSLASNPFDILYPRYAMAGLYIKVSYTTSNVLASVKVYVNMIGHKVL